MSSQHKAPLAAFVVVCVACVVVLLNAVRGEALTGFLQPVQALVSGARLVPEPDVDRDAPAAVVRPVAAVAQPVERAESAKSAVGGPARDRAVRRARQVTSSAVGSPATAAAVVAVAPATAPPASAVTRGHRASSPGRGFGSQPSRGERPDRGRDHDDHDWQHDHRPTVVRGSEHGHGWGGESRGHGFESRGRGHDSESRGRGHGSESRGRGQGFESRGHGHDSRWR